MFVVIFFYENMDCTPFNTTHAKKKRALYSDRKQGALLVDFAPTCRSLGQIETVCMVNFWAAWLLTGDKLASIPTAETLILALLCDFTLGPALPLLLLLEFL